jgi:hypothetical protein
VTDCEPEELKRGRVYPAKIFVRNLQQTGEKSIGLFRLNRHLQLPVLLRTFKGKGQLTYKSRNTSARTLADTNFVRETR